MVRELFDVQRQNFWTESIHKEAYTRLAWHEKYSKEFARESRQGKVHLLSLSCYCKSAPNMLISTHSRKFFRSTGY